MASNKSRAFFSNSGWMMAQQMYVIVPCSWRVIC